MMSRYTFSFLLMFVSLHMVYSAEQLQPTYLNEVLFATKTAYKNSRKLFAEFASHVGISHSVLDEESTSYPSSCVPDQLSVVLRHGTRYPSGGDVERIKTLENKLLTFDLSEEFHALQSWTNRFNMDNSKTLSRSGAEENVEIAQRYHRLFPELFEMSAATKNIELHSSTSSRAIDSAKAFVRGLARHLDLGDENITSGLTLRDDLLRFFERCSRYLYGVEEAEDRALVEFNRFKVSEEMQAAARRVSRRLSASGPEDMVSAEDLRAMWVTCAIETALDEVNYISPWCDLFTSNETRVIEYMFDLKAYWKKSYGYSINYEQSCPLIADVVNNMFDIMSNESAPNVSLYFGHAETMHPVYAALGLFQDDQPLLASNYQLHRDKRKFRQTFITPFAANLAFVRYRCEEGRQTSHPSWPAELDSSMIQLMFNEHPISFPFTDKMAVGFHHFETQYYQQIHHCNFDEICEMAVRHGAGGHDEL